MSESQCCHQCDCTFCGHCCTCGLDGTVPVTAVALVTVRADVSASGKSLVLCYAVKLILPVKDDSETEEAIIAVFFEEVPSYSALLDCIEETSEDVSVTTDLRHKNYHVKAGKEYMTQHNWAIVAHHGDASSLKASAFNSCSHRILHVERKTS